MPRRRFLSWSCVPELGIDDPDRNIARQFDAVIEDADRPGGEVGAARRGSRCHSGIGEANVLGLGVGIILGARACAYPPANEAAVTRLERPMPDVAAAQGVGRAVRGDPLSAGPAPLAS